jgi:hypothetical protein
MTGMPRASRRMPPGEGGGGGKQGFPQPGGWLDAEVAGVDGLDGSNAETAETATAWDRTSKLPPVKSVRFIRLPHPARRLAERDSNSKDCGFSKDAND